MMMSALQLLSSPVEKPQTINPRSRQPHRSGNEMRIYVVTKLTSFSLSREILPVGGEKRGWGRREKGKGNCQRKTEKIGLVEAQMR